MKLIEGPDEGFDIIGDVHGESEVLERLLDQMGYEPHERGFKHPTRKAIFVGDLIDRGPGIPRTLEIVTNMVESSDAYTVLGNHELSALAMHYARDLLSEPEADAFARQYITTVAAFTGRKAQLEQYLEMIKEWPFYLEHPGFRVAHACWNSEAGSVLKRYDDRSRLTMPLLKRILQWGTKERREILRVTNGVNLSLPIGLTIIGADGVERSTFRAHFWSSQRDTYGDVAILADQLPDTLASRTLETFQAKQLLKPYDAKGRPVFVGHYWLKGAPAIIRDNIACVDYVADQGQRLVAYRWSGEATLTNDAWVDISVTDSDS